MAPARLLLAVSFALSFLLDARLVGAQQLSRQAVNEAQFGIRPASVLRAQILLDRAHLSPGPIDGRNGSNMQKAIRAYETRHGLKPTGRMTREVWDALTAADGEPAIVEYVIRRDDVDGPFVESIPATLEEKAQLPRLSFTGPAELLAEKVHMDENLLKRLNAGRRLDQEGERIIVANVRRAKPAGKVARVAVDKGKEAVIAYDREDRLVAFYPATIGSRQTPSPEGATKVRYIAKNPTYVYDPAKLDFKEVKTAEKFEIAPGPNNPVGLVWIALDKPGYGIHGSPEPTAISRQVSHGCVRLTNWDALELAELVRPGTPVEFVENGGPNLTKLTRK